VNDVIRDVVPLIGTEMRSHEVSFADRAGAGVAAVLADRVQLQQVLINFVMNGIEAMASVDGRSRELVIRSQPEDDDHVVVAVQDARRRLDGEKTDQLFSAFYTTKPTAWAWTVDQPVDHRSAWRTALGDTEPGPRRDVPLRVAQDAMNRR